MGSKKITLSKNETRLVQHLLLNVDDEEWTDAHDMLLERIYSLEGEE